jgi:hypothetical protein
MNDIKQIKQNTEDIKQLKGRVNAIQGGSAHVKPDWDAAEGAPAGILNKPDLEGYEEAANKVTSLGTLNNTLYPTTQAVQTAIDNALAAINPAVAVHAASTAHLDATYSNGTAGVGATLTANSNGVLVLDTIEVEETKRVLIKNQTNPVHNGVYTVDDTGSVGTPWRLIRATDFDEPAEMDDSGAIPVLYGTVGGNKETSWLLLTNVITVGTDEIVFVQFTLNATTLVRNTDTFGVFTNQSTSNQLRVLLSDATGAADNTALVVFNLGPVLRGLYISDGYVIESENGEGFTIGGATSNKLGFWDATPIARPSGNIKTALANLGLISSPTISATDVDDIASIEVTSDHTFALTNRNRSVKFNKSTAIVGTVPPNSSVAFPIGSKINAIQMGEGALTIAPGLGVTIRSYGDKLKAAGKYVGLTLEKIGTDEWILFGNLIAA